MKNFEVKMESRSCKKCGGRFKTSIQSKAQFCSIVCQYGPEGEIEIKKRVRERWRATNQRAGKTILNTTSEKGNRQESATEEEQTPKILEKKKEPDKEKNTSEIERKNLKDKGKDMQQIGKLLTEQELKELEKIVKQPRKEEHGTGPSEISTLKQSKEVAVAEILPSDSQELSNNIKTEILTSMDLLKSSSKHLLKSMLSATGSMENDNILLAPERAQAAALCANQINQLVKTQVDLLKLARKISKETK